MSGSKSAVPDLERYLAGGISVVSINYRYSWQAQLAGVMPPVAWPLADAARAHAAIMEPGAFGKIVLVP